MSTRRRATDDVYIPHPAPTAAIPDDDNNNNNNNNTITMGGFLSVVKVKCLSSW
jgi:hypothetical protein